MGKGREMVKNIIITILLMVSFAASAADDGWSLGSFNNGKTIQQYPAGKGWTWGYYGWRRR